jgi:hypothetical protein
MFKFSFNTLVFSFFFILINDCIYKSIIIILLIIYCFNYKKYKNIYYFTNQEKKNINYNQPIIHDYKFYDSDNNSFISIIFNLSDYFNLNSINNDLIIDINELSRLTFVDTQIFVLYDFSNASFMNHSSYNFLNNKRIIKFKYDSKKWYKNFLDLIGLIKGKFLIFIDKLIKLKYTDLLEIYNITKGNISNIFEIKIQNDQLIYVIRTKILKDIIDTENEFQNFNEIIIIFPINLFQKLITFQ